MDFIKCKIINFIRSYQKTTSSGGMIDRVIAGVTISFFLMPLLSVFLINTYYDYKYSSKDSVTQQELVVEE